MGQVRKSRRLERWSKLSGNLPSSPNKMQWTHLVDQIKFYIFKNQAQNPSHHCLPCHDTCFARWTYLPRFSPAFLLNCVSFFFVIHFFKNSCCVYRKQAVVLYSHWGKDITFCWACKLAASSISLHLMWQIAHIDGIFSRNFFKCCNTFLPVETHSLCF